MIVSINMRRRFRFVLTISLLAVLIVNFFVLAVLPAHAQAGGASSLETALDDILTAVKNAIAKFAPTVAFISFVLMGIMYMGNSIPVVKDWKESNPRVFSNVMIGIGVVLLASTVSSVLTGLSTQ